MAHRPLRLLLQEGVIWSRYRNAPSISVQNTEVLQGVWKQQLDGIFGDRLDKPPPSGRYVFGCCSALEALFLFVNLTTTSPFLFERCMPYHIKYTALSLGFWGATYAGLDITRYGLSRSSIRTLIGIAFFGLGTGTIILADHQPWPAYYMLSASFVAMNYVDYAFHNHRMVPPWVFRWKVGFNMIALGSLLIGAVKGQYLERNAEWYIMREASRQDAWRRYFLRVRPSTTSLRSSDFGGSPPMKLCGIQLQERTFAEIPELGAWIFKQSLGRRWRKKCIYAILIYLHFQSTHDRKMTPTPMLLFFYLFK